MKYSARERDMKQRYRPTQKATVMQWLELCLALKVM